MTEYLIRFGGHSYSNEETIKVTSFEIKKNLSGISTCLLTLPNSLPFTIEKFDSFRILRVKDGEDTELFEGFVLELTADIDQLKIDGREDKELLNYKYVLKDKIYTNINVTEILRELVREWWETTWGLIWINSPEFDTNEYLVAHFEVKVGESIYSVLNRLSEIWSFNFSRDTRTGGVLVSTQIGIDRTLDDENYTQLLYNPKDSFGNNITNLKSTSTDKYSVILGRNKEVENEVTLQVQDTPTMDSLGLYYLYENGYLEGSTESIGKTQLGLLLDDYQQEVRLLDFEILNTLSKELDIGDKVAVEVSNSSSYLDFIGSGFITSKQIIYKNGFEVTSYKFGGSVIQNAPNLMRKLFQMKGGTNTQKNLNTIAEGKPKILN